MPGRSPEIDEQPADAPSDRFDLALRNHRERGTAAGLRPLLREAVATVWRAGRSLFVAVIVITVAAALVAISQVVIATAVLDALLAGGRSLQLDRVLPPALTLAALAVAGLILSAVGGQLQRLLGELVVRDTEGRVLAVTTGVALDAYESPRFTDHLVRIQQNALAKPLDVVSAITGLLSGLVACAGLSAVVGAIEPLLLPLLALTAVPIVLVNRRAGRHEFAFATEQAPPLRERLYLGDLLSGREMAKEVRAFDLTDLVRGRWDARYRTYVDGLRALVRRRTVLATSGAVASGLLLAITLVFLLWQVQRGRVPLAQAGAAVIAMRMLVGRLQTVAAGATRLFEARLFLSDLADFLAWPLPEAPSSNRPGPGPLRVLDVDHVCYTYPGSDRTVIDDVSFTVGRGEIVALVGENGSGKTTLAKLLAHLYAPTSGAIRWNGVRIGDDGAAAVRRRIAVIFQDFARFQLSAEENIAVGRAHSDLDPVAIRDAARRAGTDDVLTALPNGYATMLSKAMPVGSTCRWGSGSGSRSPGRSTATPTSWCSTNRRRRSTRGPSTSCSRACGRCCRTAPRC